MIARIIAGQLGGNALALLGAHTLVDIGDGLQFRIQGSESVNLIQIILDPCDTYTVKFSRQAGQCVSSRQWRRPISESLTRR